MASPKRKVGQQDFFDHSADMKAEAGVIIMPTPENTNPQQPPLRIGEILKRERERRGYDLQQIADHLCIRRGLLAALEGSRYEEFPADAYVIGFLRSYADLIGLNGQEAIDHYRKEMAGRRKKPDLVLPSSVSDSRAPTAVVMGVAAFACLLIYVLWYAFSTSDRTTVTTPPALPTTTGENSPATTAPDATTTNPVSATSSTPTALQTTATQPLPTAGSAAETLSASTPSGIMIAAPAPSQKETAGASPSASNTTTAVKQGEPAPTASPATASGRITIKADQSSWILIADSKGQTVFDRVLKPGESYQVPNTPGLTLTTGNGAGIILFVDGAELPRLSTTTSHIVRNVPLESAALKALPQQPAQ